LKEQLGDILFISFVIASGEAIIIYFEIGKNVISWFYAYVEHIEIKTKTVNVIHFPYLDLSQNVKIRDVPYSLKSPRNFES
jgi:hypothetical protein